jgi:hypothetical protein
LNSSSGNPTVADAMWGVGSAWEALDCRGMELWPHRFHCMRAALDWFARLHLDTKLVWRFDPWVNWDHPMVARVRKAEDDGEYWPVPEGFPAGDQLEFTPKLLAAFEAIGRLLDAMPIPDGEWEDNKPRPESDPPTRGGRYEPAVTLDYFAVFVHVSKGALKKKMDRSEDAPKPVKRARQGHGGQAYRYSWPKLRAWALENYPVDADNIPEWPPSQPKISDRHLGDT